MSEQIRCVVCARRDPRDGATVCDPCLGRIDDNLARIAEVTAWASAWLMPRAGHSDGGRSVPGSRPPLDIASLDAALGNDALPVLEAWERMVREQHHLAPYGVATALNPASVAGSVAFLRSWLLRLCEDAEWPIEQFADEINTLRWGGKFGDERFAGLERLDPEHEKPDGTRVPCSAPHPEGDGRECGHRIVINMDRPADDVTCRRCGNVTTGGRIILAALSDPRVTVWAYPADISSFGVDATTLRKWHERGHIRRNGNRYDVGAAWRRRMNA